MKLKAKFGAMTKAEREEVRTKLLADMGKGGIEEGLAQVRALSAVDSQPGLGQWQVW